MGAASRDQVVKTVAPDAPFAVSDQTPGPGSYSLPPPRQRRAKGFSVSLWPCTALESSRLTLCVLSISVWSQHPR